MDPLSCRLFNLPQEPQATILTALVHEDELSKSSKPVPQPWTIPSQPTALKLAISKPIGAESSSNRFHHPVAVPRSQRDCPNKDPCLVA